MTYQFWTLMRNSSTVSWQSVTIIRRHNTQSVSRLPTSWRRWPQPRRGSPTHTSWWSWCRTPLRSWCGFCGRPALPFCSWEVEFIIAMNEKKKKLDNLLAPSYFRVIVFMRSFSGGLTLRSFTGQMKMTSLSFFTTMIRCGKMRLSHLPEYAKQLSEPGLDGHHEGDGCQSGETRGTDLVPEQANDHHSLDRCQPQVVQVECNLWNGQIKTPSFSLLLFILRHS